MEVFIGPLIALVVILAIIIYGICDSNRYDPDDPSYRAHKRELDREWEERQTRQATYDRLHRKK